MGKNKYAKQSREAQTRHRKSRMCERKRQYDTEEEAQKGWEKHQVYLCPHCNQYHRTSAIR